MFGACMCLVSPMIDSGGEEAALAAMKKNIAVMYFAEV